MLWLKLGQILGFVLMAAGVVAFVADAQNWTLLILLGIVVYAACRMVAWLRKP